MSNKTDTKKTKMIDPDYVPFGPEWEKEILRHTKAEIVPMLRDALKKKLIGNAFEKLEQAVINCEVRMMQRMDSRFDALVSKLLPPSPPAVVEEQWVPKVGELAVVECDDFQTKMPRGTVGVIDRMNDDFFQILGGGIFWNFRADELRQPTSEEVLAYKERLERSKVNELQPNDGCLVDPDFLREMRMLELPSYSRPLDSDRECEYLEWDQGKLYRCRYLPGKPSPIPNTEFLRRARGTAARLKEEAKPLEFSRVRVTVRDRQYVLIDGPNELGYYAMYDMGNKAIYHAKRSEFTIKS